MTQQFKKSSNDNGLLKVAAVLAIFTLISVFAVSFKSDESNLTLKVFSDRMSTFKHHVESSHWQWKVQQASRIMLKHYDNQGNEITRKPVPINHYGWPGGAMNDDGCAKLWTSLTAEPLDVEGFKVHARFYSRGGTNSEIFWCRFSLSRGPYFDYFPATGKISELDT